MTQHRSQNIYLKAIATGFLKLKEKSIDAIFTLPEYMEYGAAGLIIVGIKKEALRQNIKTINVRISSYCRKFLSKIRCYITRFR